MDRRAAREQAMILIFESQFQAELEKEDILLRAEEVRELEQDSYMKAVFFASIEHRAEIDAKIEKFAVGRKLNRLSRVALAVLRLSVTEMCFLPEEYAKSVPFWVSINEALELIKRFDHDVPPRFINGVLNAIAEDAGLKAQQENGEQA